MKPFLWLQAFLIVAAATHVKSWKLWGASSDEASIHLKTSQGSMFVANFDDEVVSKDESSPVPAISSMISQPVPSPPTVMSPTVASHHRNQQTDYNTPAYYYPSYRTSPPVYNTQPTYYYKPSYGTPRPVYNSQPSNYYPRPVYNSRPSYYNPSYGTNPTYYSSRNNPSYEEESSSSVNGNVLVGVVIMFFVSMIIIICGWNCGADDTENFDSPSEAIQAFHEELFSKKYLAFTIRDKKVARRYALFFTTRIKCKWKPFCAYVQFAMGWLSFITSVVGLFAPANAVNSVLGCGAMFVSEVVVHVWYGYFRYPNVTTWCGLSKLDTEYFCLVKEYSTLLYHGDDEVHEDKRIDLVGFIPTLVFHFSSFFFIIVLIVAIIAKQSNDNNNNRNNNSNNSNNIPVEELLPLVVWLGALLGSLIYPLCFLFITNPAVKIIAPILHHIAQEYYEAKLFEKDLNHLLISIVFKFFGETFLPILDEPIEFAAELKEQFNDLEDMFDIKEEEQNTTTRNETDSNDNDDNFETKEEHTNTPQNAVDRNDDNDNWNDEDGNKDEGNFEEVEEDNTTRNDSDSDDFDDKYEDGEMEIPAKMYRNESEEAPAHDDGLGKSPAVTSSKSRPCLDPPGEKN